jgi:hypothetical protein
LRPLLSPFTAGPSSAASRQLHPFPDGNGRTGRALVHGMLRHPVVDAALVSRQLGIRPQHVYRELNPLVTAGVLTTSGSARDRVWRSAELLAAVDAFAVRSTPTAHSCTVSGR